MAPCAFLRLSGVVSRDRVNVCHTSAGVDLLAFGGTPGSEGSGIDVHLQDDFALCQMTFTQALGGSLPIFEGIWERGTVGKDRFQQGVVRRLIPGQANDTIRVHEIAHEQRGMQWHIERGNPKPVNVAKRT